MPCRYFRSPDGKVQGIICGSRAPVKRCSVCQRPSTRECDYPTPTRKSGTCDKPLCAKCARQVGPDRDYCPSHPLTPPAPAQAPAEPSPPSEPRQLRLFK